MLRGLYTAASGLNAEMVEQDVVANNIANANTLGFKRDTPILEAFPNRLLERIHDRMDKVQVPMPEALAAAQPAQPLGFMGQGVQTAETAVEFTPGPLTRTDQPLDLAIQGNALFAVQRGDGSMAYTRAGNFTVDSNKQLATLDGNVVMDRDNHPILFGTPTVINPQHVVVDIGGGVQVDGQRLGVLKLVGYDPSDFTKVGDNLYVRHEEPIEAFTPDAPPAGVQVLQGYVEQSNVPVVTEMVRMISLMRAYEENTKAMTMQDQTLSQLISSVGTPSA